MNYDWQNKVFLGKGAFGKVYKAKSKTNDEWFAVKEVKPKSKDIDPLREVELLEKIRTAKIPGVLQYVEGFFDKGAKTYYLVFELLEGGSLDEFMGGEAVPEVKAVKIIRNVCNIMDAVNENCSIAHRDLKPENIMFKDTEHKILKIIDFGIGKEVGWFTSLKTPVGSTYWAAPEVIMNGSRLPKGETRKKYLMNCDVWSVGVITYQLLFNDVPFKSINEILEKDLFISGSCSTEAAAFMERCLNRDKDERPHFKDLLKDDWLLLGAGTLDPPMAKKKKAPKKPDDEQKDDVVPTVAKKKKQQDDNVGKPAPTKTPEEKQVAKKIKEIKTKFKETPFTESDRMEYMSDLKPKAVQPFCKKVIALGKKKEINLEDSVRVGLKKIMTPPDT